MNKYFFKLSDFFRIWTPDGWHYCDQSISPEFAQIVFENHFIPQNEMRMELDIPMRITSCFRAKNWELRQGRDGTSQHCFPENSYCAGIGASDVEPWYPNQCTPDVLVSMAESLISKFRRVCFYPAKGIFHNDYKAKHDQRFVYDNGWEYVSNHDEWIEIIKDNQKI